MGSGCSSASASAPVDDGPLTREPRPGVDVTQRGVSLSYLLRFASSVRADATVADVVVEAIRPRSAASRCCYFDIIPDKHVGAPRVFISHTWSGLLRDLVDNLVDHFEAQLGKHAAGGAMIWLDIFAINQHAYEGTTLLLEDDVKNLAAVISAVDTTLFCLDKNGTALTRVWCLYEVWKTITLRSTAQFCMLTFHLAPYELLDVILNLHVHEAKATNDADRVRILADIQESVGLTEMNRQILHALTLAGENDVGRSMDAGKLADMPKVNGAANPVSILQMTQRESDQLIKMQMVQQAASACEALLPYMDRPLLQPPQHAERTAAAMAAAAAQSVAVVTATTEQRVRTMRMVTKMQSVEATRQQAKAYREMDLMTRSHGMQGVMQVALQDGAGLRWAKDAVAKLFEGCNPEYPF